MKHTLKILAGICLLALFSSANLNAQARVCDCKPSTKSIGDEVVISGETYTVVRHHLQGKACKDDCSGFCWWTWYATNEKGWEVSKGEYVGCEWKTHQVQVINKNDLDLVLEYLHPNPVTAGASLNYELEIKKGSALVELMDVQGKVHRSQTLSIDDGRQQQLSTQGLSQGMYILKISSPSESHSYRVVIQ